MESWTAGQVGDSFGAYVNRDVEFTIGDHMISGKLTRSDTSFEGPYTYLWVDGRMWTLTNDAPITIR